MQYRIIYGGTELPVCMVKLNETVVTYFHDFKIELPFVRTGPDSSSIFNYSNVPLLENIGEGQFSKVFKPHDKRIIIKIQVINIEEAIRKDAIHRSEFEKIILTYPQTVSDFNQKFEKETTIHRKMVALSLAPTLYNSFMCELESTMTPTVTNHSFLIMNKYDGPLFDEDCQITLTDGDIQKIMILITAMHDNNITHNDLHGNNIMYYDKGGVREWGLIDFGESIDFHETVHAKIQTLCKLNDYMTLHTGLSEATVTEYNPLKRNLRIKFEELKTSAIQDNILTNKDLDDEYIEL
jgi:serine/threonine protein kinase